MKIPFLVELIQKEDGQVTTRIVMARSKNEAEEVVSRFIHDNKDKYLDVYKILQTIL